MGKSLRIVRGPTTAFHDDLDRFHQEDPEFRVAVACQAACQVDTLRLALEGSHPHLKTITLTGQDSGETKRMFFRERE